MSSQLAAALHITEAEAAHVEQWMLRAIPHVEAGMSAEEALAKGQEEYSAFLWEMHQGETSRAKMAREVLGAEVWGQCNLQGARERALASCDQMEHGAMMRRLRADLGEVML